jgi:hypothetical protein
VRAETSADRSLYQLTGRVWELVITPRGGRTDGAGRRPGDWPRLGRALVVRSAGVVASPWPARDASATGGSTPGTASGCETIRLHSGRSRDRDTRVEWSRSRDRSDARRVTSSETRTGTIDAAYSRMPATSMQATRTECAAAQRGCSEEVRQVGTNGQRWVERLNGALVNGPRWPDELRDSGLDHNRHALIASWQAIGQRKVFRSIRVVVFTANRDAVC